MIAKIVVMRTYEGRVRAHPTSPFDRLIALFRRHTEPREAAPIPVAAEYAHRPYVPPPPPAAYRLPPGRYQ